MKVQVLKSVKLPGVLKDLAKEHKLPKRGLKHCIRKEEITDWELQDLDFMTDRIETWAAVLEFPKK